MKVAVVGSGISGLAAAYYLVNSGATITLFERSATFGGHAASVLVEQVGPQGKVVVPVNPAYDIFNKVSYPRYLQLLDSLGIGYAPCEFSYTYTRVASDGRTPEAQWRLPTFLNLGNVAQLLNPDYARFALAGLKLGRHVRRYRYQAGAAQTWGGFLAASGIPQCYVDDVFLPLFARPWGVTPTAMRDMPVEIVVHWVALHKALSPRPVPWLSNVGGAGAYIEQLVAHLRSRGVNLLARAGIRSVGGDERGAFVEIAGGGRQYFDHVIVATNAREALALRERPGDAEIGTLGAIAYQRNQVIVHGDTRLLPARQRDWSYFNVRYDPVGKETINSIWFGRQHGVPVFATNFRVLPFEIAPDKIHARFEFEQPILDATALKARTALPSIQGRDNIWFCGVYACGVGHHEDGLASAAAVVERLRPGAAP